MIESQNLIALCIILHYFCEPQNTQMQTRISLYHDAINKSYVNVLLLKFKVLHFKMNKPDDSIPKIVAAFRGMHVLPAKHSYARLPRKCDYRTDRQTDVGQRDPYELCFAGDTKIPMCCYAQQATQKLWEHQFDNFWRESNFTYH